MNRLVPGLAIFLMSLVVAPNALAPNALAQRATYTQGATSSDLASTINTVRQQNAQMNLDISRLEDRITQLNGKIETLEFLLSQSRDESGRMQEDDKRIGQALQAMTARNEELEGRVEDLEQDIDRLVQAISSGELAADAPTDGRQPDAELRRRTEADTASASSTEDGERRIVRQEAREDDAEAGVNPNVQGSLGTLQASNLPGDAGPLFATAKTRLLKFDYAGAEDAFRAFLAQFSDDPQAGEAQYWLAETLFQQEAYAESGQAYTQMIREYPDDARAPDALVKLSRSMRLVGDTEKACNALEILPEQYPNASGVTKNLASLERSRAGCDS